LGNHSSELVGMEKRGGCSGVLKKDNVVGTGIQKSKHSFHEKQRGGFAEGKGEKKSDQVAQESGRGKANAEGARQKRTFGIFCGGG